MASCYFASIVSGVSGEGGFFHAIRIHSDCLSLSQASQLVGKARATQKERVATAARYPLSMGQMDRAAFFCPFSILSMYSGMLGVLSHHVGMARRISTTSVLSRPLQLSARWPRSCLVVTLL